MKKLIFIFFIISNFVQSQELGFTDVTITTTSAEDINVFVKAVSNCGVYLSHETVLTGSNITLKVCYIFCGGGIILYPENNFQINLPIQGLYNLDIIAYESTNQNICDFNNIQDTANLSFTTPLSGPVTLSTTAIIENNDNIIYPNPTSGSISLNNNIDSILIYDNIGRKVKQYINFKNSMVDISEFENGVYFIETNESNKRNIQKIILKK